MRNNFAILLAQKAQQEGRRRISVSEVARATGLSRYTLNAFLDHSIQDYPATALASLCEYLGCDIADFLRLETVPESTTNAG